MRSLTLLLFLLLSLLMVPQLSSCRASRHVVAESSDSLSVAVDSVAASVESSQVEVFFTSASALELSGITVEFFPPDSSHPDARAAPRSITIRKASAAKLDSFSNHETRLLEHTSALSASTIHTSMKAEHSDLDVQDPVSAPFRVFIPLILGFIITLLTLKFFHQK